MIFFCYTNVTFPVVFNTTILILSFFSSLSEISFYCILLSCHYISVVLICLSDFINLNFFARTYAFSQSACSVLTP